MSSSVFVAGFGRTFPMIQLFLSIQVIPISTGAKASSVTQNPPNLESVCVTFDRTDLKALKGL